MTENSLQRQDEQAREDVLNTGLSFIVKAPAGAGKTSLLVQRYLALLAVVNAPEEIIAITFTRKAAAEMRARVISAFALLDSDPGELKPHHIKMRELAEKAKKRDVTQGWELAKHSSRMRIMTIDAFTGWLARQQPWIAGQGALGDVTERADDLYVEAVQRVLNSKNSDDNFNVQLQRLLIHLNNKYASVETKIVSLLKIRDQWQRLDKGMEELNRDQLETILATFVQRYLRKLVEACPSFLDELPSLAAHAAKTLLDEGKTAENEPIVLLNNMTSLPGSEAEYLDQWKSIAALLLTKKNELRKKVDKSLGFYPQTPEASAIKELLEQLKDDADSLFIPLLSKVRPLPATRYTEEQWEILGVIKEILSKSKLELSKVFSEKNLHDHTEISAAALKVLGDECNPTERALQLEYQIQHILVDEFQDTSVGQFRLLERLTEAWIADDGHSLFLVGDPMQSIYRFREAEVGLFINTWEQGRIGSVPLTRTTLRKNFRSIPGIVDWVNNTFSEVFPAHNDTFSGAVEYSESLPDMKSATGKNEAVIVKPFISTDQEKEAAYIAAETQRLISDNIFDRSRDPAIAILVRNRKHLLPIARALRKTDQSFRAVEIESLASTPMVRDLLSLTFALLHPGDDVSAFSVLRAPWCGVSLETLTRIAEERQNNTVLFAAQQCLDKNRIPERDKTALARCLAVLTSSVTRLGRMRLRTVVEYCWMCLGGPDTADDESSAAALAFFDTLDACDEGGGLKGFQEIRKRIEELYAPPDPAADIDVQLMTIHKAKGLQFDVVFLPQLQSETRRMDNEILFWLTIARDNDVDFLFAPIVEKGKTDTTYDWVKSVLGEKDDNEAVRLLYVAATRAKFRLYLTATLNVKVKKDATIEMSQPRSRSFLNNLWSVFEDGFRSELDNLHDSVPAADMDENAVSLPVQWLRRLTDAWSPPEWPTNVELPQTTTDLQSVDAEMKAPFRAGEEARLTGIIVHGILALLAKHGTTFWTNSNSETRRKLMYNQLQSIKLPDSIAHCFTTAELAIARMLEDERGQWILRQRPESWQEWHLSAVLDDVVYNVVIDRSFIDDDGTRWIIDYKTATHEGSDLEGFLENQIRQHTKQIQRYARVVSGIDDRPRRLALYFPLLSKWYEFTSTV